MIIIFTRNVRDRVQFGRGTGQVRNGHSEDDTSRGTDPK